MTDAGHHRDRRVVLIASIASAVIVVVGVAVVVWSLLIPVSVGWFAYAPLSGRVLPGPGAAIVPRSALLGAVVATIGLVGLSLAIGYSIGRRHGAAPPRTSD